MEGTWALPSEYWKTFWIDFSKKSANRVDIREGKWESKRVVGPSWDTIWTHTKPITRNNPNYICNEIHEQYKEWETTCSFWLMKSTGNHVFLKSKVISMGTFTTSNAIIIWYWRRIVCKGLLNLIIKPLLLATKFVPSTNYPDNLANSANLVI